jgi:hypothetical protein
MTRTETRTKWYEKYQVDWPEAVHGSWAIERFEINKDAASFWNLRAAINGDGRAVRPGGYTKLVHAQRGTVMSDTPSEIGDHLEFFRELERERTKRVLIHGLGLGMAVRWALLQPHVEHVDVVEIDDEVSRLMFPNLRPWAREGRLRIHPGDALEYRFPTGARWDVAWHDIWDSITTDNLPTIARLKRRYGGRVTWQGAWCEEEIRYHRDRERRSYWR